MWQQIKAAGRHLTDTIFILAPIIIAVLVSWYIYSMPEEKFNAYKFKKKDVEVLNKYSKYKAKKGEVAEDE